MSRIIGTGLAGVVLVSHAPAAAQPMSAEQVVSRTLARACQERAGQTITRGELAEALVVEARPKRGLREQAAVAEALAGGHSPTDVPPSFYRYVSELQRSLARPGSSAAKALRVEPAPAEPTEGQTPMWLFRSGDITLTCAGPRADDDPGFAEVGPIVVRGSVEALDDVGDDRVAAAAAQVGFQETRVTDLDGETTRTEAVTVDATIGLAIGTTDRHGMVYADYSRNRTETRTGTDAAEVDNVEALELGLFGSTRIARVARATGRIAVTFDEVTEAQYLRGNLRLLPITGGRGLFCLNRFRTFRDFGIRVRCTLSGEAELRLVLDEGRAEIGDTDVLAAFGGSVGLDFARSLDRNTGDPRPGLVGSVRYTYLANVEGPLPDIDRLDASLSYRWWIGDLGFDVGITYADGTERKSFADENRFGFRIGVLY